MFPDGKSLLVGCIRGKTSMLDEKLKRMVDEWLTQSNREEM
jgi:hypothetical protein